MEFDERDVVMWCYGLVLLLVLIFYFKVLILFFIVGLLIVL